MAKPNPININLSDQIFSQATQAITIQEKYNAQYIHELRQLAKNFPAEKNTLQILEAVFPTRLQIQCFELEADFSLTMSSEKETGMSAQLSGIPIPLSYDAIYEEAHSCESRITIEVDQWSCGEVKEVELPSN